MYCYEKKSMKKKLQLGTRVVILSSSPRKCLTFSIYKKLIHF